MLKEFKTADTTDREEDFFRTGKGLYGGDAPNRRANGRPNRLQHVRILDPFGAPDVVERWRSKTSNVRPLEMEIGFGPGSFLIARGQNNPATTFLGFEVRTKQCSELLDRVDELNLENVWVVQTDARPVLQSWIADEQLRELHINFPDPWWKKRHHKRRIFTPGFVEVAATKLETGGSVWLRTDVEAYAKHVAELFADSPLFETMSFGEGVLEWTHRETRCVRYGMPVYRLQMRKK